MLTLHVPSCLIKVFKAAGSPACKIERQRQTERDRDSDREKERQRDTQRQRRRERQRQPRVTERKRE